MGYLIYFILILFACQVWAQTVAVSELDCKADSAAKVVSLQGQLFVDKQNHGQWQALGLEASICEGSRIHLDQNSRASLLLPDNIILRLDSGTVLTLNSISKTKPTILDMLKGFVHFISRTPRHMQITTPIANAGPEGTEFALQADEASSSVWVFEGIVNFFNDQGALHLKPGETALAESQKAPQTRLDIKPLDAVNWALYYPALLPFNAKDNGQTTAMQKVIDAFRHGYSDMALSDLSALSSAKQNPNYHKLRAAIYLSLGRIEQANQDISALQAENPQDPDAFSLIVSASIESKSKGGSV